LKSLYVAVAAGSTGVYTIAGTSSLTLTNSDNFLFVGNNGNGTFIQSNGTVQTASSAMVGRKPGSVGLYTIMDGDMQPNTLIIAEEAGATGVVNVTGGAVSSIYALRVGFAGNGTVNHSGGTVEVTASGQSLTIGNGAGSYGEYELSGAASIILTNNNYFYVGEAGTGIFNQSGGTVTVAALSMVGRHANSHGTYNLTGGTLNPATLIVGEAVGSTGVFTMVGGTIGPSGHIYIPQYGNSGTFNHSGGTIAGASGSQVFIGFGADTDGSYTMGGSADMVLTNSNNFLLVGEYGTGSLIQTGGAVRVGGSTVIARRANTIANYDISGGLLLTRDLSICEPAGSTGTLYVAGTGATIEVSNNFFQYGSDSTLHVQIGSDGVTPIMVTNTATLAGTLKVSLGNTGYPDSSDVITVVNAASLSGAYESTNCVFPLVDVNVVYENGDVKLTDFQIQGGSVFKLR